MPRRSDSSRRSEISSSLLLARQLGDALDQAGFVELVGDLGDDDAVAVACPSLRCAPGRAARSARARCCRPGRMPSDPTMTPPVGKSGPGMKRHQLFDRDVVDALVVVDQVDQGGRQLAQVVGRDIGRHADGDAGGAVEQQVGQAGGQHRRLFQRAVEVVDRNRPCSCRYRPASPRP